MMLRHLGLNDHANRISNAVYSTIRDGKVSGTSSPLCIPLILIISLQVKTKDIGGHSSTREFTDAVIKAL